MKEGKVEDMPPSSTSLTTSLSNSEVKPANTLNLLGDEDVVTRTDAQTRTADLLNELEQRQSPSTQPGRQQTQPLPANLATLSTAQATVQTAIQTASRQTPQPLNLKESNLTEFQSPQMLQKSPPAYMGGVLNPAGKSLSPTSPVTTVRATMAVMSPTNLSTPLKTPLSAPPTHQTDPYQALRALSESTGAKQPGQSDYRRQSVPLPGLTSPTVPSLYGYQQPQQSQMQGFAGFAGQPRVMIQTGAAGFQPQGSQMMSSNQEFGGFQQANYPMQASGASWSQNQQPAAPSPSPFDDLDPLGKSRQLGAGDSKGSL